MADPRVHPRPISRNGTTWLALTRNPEGLNAFKQIVPASRSQIGEQQVHPGYEWMYILSGTLLLALGDEQYRLHAGEVVEFDTTNPHAIANAGANPVELIIIYSNNSDRLHVNSL